MLTDIQGGQVASAADISPAYPSQRSISLPAGNSSAAARGHAHVFMFALITFSLCRAAEPHRRESQAPRSNLCLIIKADSDRANERDDWAPRKLLEADAENSCAAFEPEIMRRKLAGENEG